MNFSVPELAYTSAAAYTTATEAQAHVDEEICKLRSLRNTFSFTCRLPLEILAAIFVRYVLDHHNHNSSSLACDASFRDVPSWVSVSHVCRHWRNVALECPVLWSHHFIVSLRWTEELLARSKQAPLRICLRIDDKESDHWWLGPVERLMKNAERFEEFSLRVNEQDIARVLSMLSESSRSPCLRSLRMSTMPLKSEHSEQSFLPFHGDTPALRTLELSYCPVPWRSFNLSSLTTLDLCCLPARFHDNIVDILAILRVMENLTKLGLDNVLASASGFLSSPAFHNFQEVNLPHLSRLSIDAPLSTVIALLYCVNIPSKTVVRLSCSHEDNSSSAHYTLLSSILAQRLDVFQDQPKTRSLIIRLAGMAEVIFSPLERDCDERAQGRHSGIPLSTLFWSLGLTMPGVQFISDLVSTIPLTNVQTLYAEYPPHASAFWRKILGNLPDLRYINLVSGKMPDLVSVLSLTDPISHEDAENQDRDRTVLVPRLEELQLSYVTFSSGSDSVPPFPAITSRQLFDALSTRNVPHGRLNLLNCNVEYSGYLPDVVGRSWNDLTDIPVIHEGNSDSYEEDLEDGSEDNWDSGDMEDDSEGDDVGDSEDNPESGLEDGSEEEDLENN